ncbi:pyruvate kinase [Formosa sp. S-31]|uniref:pyruvate kinase n=1 Tax=Formosa sp. S-31 TaxID=2790949 RepID=UPI003EB79CBF
MMIPKLKIVNRLLVIREALLKVEEEHQELLAKIHNNYKYSALNFLRYLKFRTYDLTEIQSELTNLGISSLSHAERHVLANIENILYLLSAHFHMDFKGEYDFGEHPINYKSSAEILRQNTVRLLGEHIGKQGVMVTLPSDGADATFLSGLLNAGMNIARINCSHDTQKVWASMISELQKASVELNKPCTIYMDLSGPKIRTDQIFSQSIEEEVNDVRLQEGDSILLLSELSKLKPGKLKKYVAAISCTLPQIIEDAKEGDSILFDDGKIEGVVGKKKKSGLVIRILNAGPNGKKLKKEKGINLPDTHLNLPSLTNEDISNLDFICKHADVVGFSFVRQSVDVKALQQELQKRGRADMGIVLKIENNEAFYNLPHLLFKAMESSNVGVMTARGDLAVELGVERLSEVQEEIMWFCEAALIPNIWATQVLESLAKKGVASRAEITDAAMSVRTECIMLNKGPYIVKALTTLQSILSRMEKHQSKKQGTLRSLQVASTFLSQNEA